MTIRSKTPEKKATLSITEIADQYIRKNFENLKAFIEKEIQLKGFRAFELSFTAVKANYKFKHGLGFQPKDVIVTSLIGSGSIQWNYASFDALELDLTITGTVSAAAPTTIRFLVGTMEAIK